jgi:uncharacterized protein (TIGR00725 family)
LLSAHSLCTDDDDDDDAIDGDAWDWPMKNNDDDHDDADDDMANCMVCLTTDDDDDDNDNDKHKTHITILPLQQCARNAQRTSCNRYGVDVREYQKELKQFTDKKTVILAAEPMDKHKLKQYQDMIDETELTLRDVQTKAEFAHDTLAKLLKKYADNTAVQDSKEYTKAKENLAVAGAIIFPNGAAAAAAQTNTEAKTTGGGSVAVFGSARCLEGDALWTLAEQLGFALATARYSIVNGGYTGTMTAMAKGARKVTGAVVKGITAPQQFKQSKPNAFLTAEIKAASFTDRLSQFNSHAATACVALPGNVGTLTELLVYWNQETVMGTQQGATASKSLPVFAFREPWEKVIRVLAVLVGISDDDVAKIVFVDTVDELITKLNALGSSSSTASTVVASSTSSESKQ